MIILCQSFIIACFEIKVFVGFHKEEDVLKFSREWEIGSCYGPKLGNTYDSNTMRTTYDRCCLLPGEYTLTCVNKKSEYGWGNAYLEIDGARYCDDFSGSWKAMRKISVYGKRSFQI